MGGGSDLEHLSGTENVMLGAASGCCAKLVNYPLLVFKNMTQQGLPLPRNPAQIYRGLPMAALNLGGTTAIQFGATGFFQRSLYGALHNHDQAQMGGAFLGGLFSGIPGCVWELTMIQQQRFGGSLVSVPVRIVSEYGIAGLFRGLTTTMGREALFTLAMLGLTPAIQHELSSDDATFVKTLGVPQLNSDVALAAGALTGSIFAATLSHPMDTIKTCLQGDLSRAKFATNSGTYAILVKEAGGVTGLFKGLSWRISLIATTFFLVNRIKQELCPIMFPDVASKANAATTEGKEKS